MRDGGDHQPTYDGWVQRTHGPGDLRPPVVTDDDCVAFAQRADQAGDVRRQRQRVVAPRWLVTRAVAAHVGRDGAVAALCEGEHLMPPRPPELGEPVQQDDQGSAADFGYVEADAVRADVA